MSAHTPGPWAFVWHDGDRKITAPSKDGRYLHETLMCDAQYYPWCPTEDADWRLIAAAPALLEALQLVRDYVVTMKGRGHEYQVVIDAAIEAATNGESA